MIIILQLLLFCLLFTLMVRIAAIGGGINALYFYPKAVQEKAFSLGLTDEKTVKRKRLLFMIPFMLVMLLALLLIIGLWNGVKDFWTAYLQALLFLVTAIVLILTMICVATTMMAVVAERRKEVGLRKALGASNRSIIFEFMGEGLLLGGVGGLVGSFLGFLFAQMVSANVFNSSITFHFGLVPLTIIVSVLVTGLSCILPVRSAIDIDPALVLKGE